MSRHIGKLNNRQHVILSIIAAPLDWTKLPVSHLDGAYTGEWTSAIHIQDELRSEGGGSLAIARDISEARYHLQRLMPGWTVKNRLTREGGKTKSFYRIERMAT